MILTSLTHPDILEKKPSSSASLALINEILLIWIELSYLVLKKYYIQLEASLQRKSDWESTRRFPNPFLIVVLKISFQYRSMKYYLKFMLDFIKDDFPSVCFDYQSQKWYILAWARLN